MWPHNNNLSFYHIVHPDFTQNVKTNCSIEETISDRNIYLLKYFSTSISICNNGNTRTLREICSKSTVKIPERRQSVFIVNLNGFQTLIWCFHGWFWTSKYRPGYFSVLQKRNRAHLVIFLHLIKDQSRRTLR